MKKWHICRNTRRPEAGAQKSAEVRRWFESAFAEASIFAEASAYAAATADRPMDKPADKIGFDWA